MYTLLLRLSRKWHRWTAWGIGIFVLMWFVTGIVMVYPFQSAARSAPPAALALDSTIMAPGAVLRLLSARETVGEVRSVQLRQIGDRTVYLFSGKGGAHAIDARTGAPFVLAETTAVRLLTRLAREGATVNSVRALTRGDLEFAGPFPAYRVEFGGTGAAVAFMANNGEAEFRNGALRFKNLAGRLHTFVVPRVPMSIVVRRTLLIVASLVACFLAITGYFLLLPVRRRAE